MKKWQEIVCEVVGLNGIVAALLLSGHPMWALTLLSFVMLAIGQKFKAEREAAAEPDMPDPPQTGGVYQLRLQRHRDGYTVHGSFRTDKGVTGQFGGDGRHSRASALDCARVTMSDFLTHGEAVLQKTRDDSHAN